MNNLVMAIIPSGEAELVVSALIEAGFTSTVLDTKGGVFRQSQKTLFIVVDDQYLEAVLKIIKTNRKIDMGNEEGSPNRKNHELSDNVKRIGRTIVFTWMLDRNFSF